VSTKTDATIEDLCRVPENGKAGIFNGELVMMSPTGGLPAYAASEIFVSLRGYSRRTKTGHAVPDNVGFIVNLSGRTSFSPDAAFYVGKLNMKFCEGAPVFAVEVRSENNYGPVAEWEIVSKRADYFAPGTLVVWDVDLLSDTVVRVYRASDPDNSTIYRRGELAEAEPAVPGWSMQVDDLFYPSRIDL
jgi:Uma2 family endonuclease